MKNIRILLWAPFGAGTHYWGPGTSAYRLYKNNQTKNIKVTLIHGSDYQEQFPDVYEEQIQLGHLDKKKPLNMFIYLIRSMIWITRNHRRYDVFHGLTAYFHTFLPALYFNKFKKPTFIKITGLSGGFTNNGRISKWSGFTNLRKKKANKLSGYISVSTDITNSLLSQGICKKKIFYIPNGVDINRFFVTSNFEKIRLRQNKKIENIFTVCYIGGLTENKRVIETLKAIHELSRKGYKLQFLIVGPDRSGGVIETEILEYIEAHNLEKKCIRIKHTSQPELYFQLSDAFVLNSEFEGLSNALLEAMSCGLPCIATPASGTVDLIKDGFTGFITDGSPQKIAGKIELLYNDSILYNKIAKNAREEIVEQFSVQHVWHQHVQLFKGNYSWFYSNT